MEGTPKETYKPVFFFLSELAFFSHGVGNNILRQCKVGKDLLEHFFMFRCQRISQLKIRWKGRGRKWGIDGVHHGCCNKVMKRFRVIYISLNLKLTRLWMAVQSAFGQDHRFESTSCSCSPVS